jgi:hypothetical protein
MLNHTYKYHGEYDWYLLKIRHLHTFHPENGDVKPLRDEKGNFVVIGYLKQCCGSGAF